MNAEVFIRDQKLFEMRAEPKDRATISAEIAELHGFSEMSVKEIEAKLRVFESILDATNQNLQIKDGLIEDELTVHRDEQEDTILALLDELQSRLGEDMSREITLDQMEPFELEFK